MKLGKTARVWAAPVLVLAVLGLLAGCGGGGGSTANPLATPSPSASPVIVGVAAQQAASFPTGGNAPTVKIQWGSPTFAPAANVLEDHVYRGDAIVGVVTKRTTQFYDAVSGDFSGYSVTYYTINPNDNTKLNLVTVYPSFTLVQGGSVKYRVTALYTTAETAASATPEYAEAEIGTSDTITLQ